MYGIYRNCTDGYVHCTALTVHFFILFSSDPISGGPGSPENALATCGPETQHIALQFAKMHTICCVAPLPRDPSHEPKTGRFVYSFAVVHFRKVSDCVKVGSGDYHHPII